MADPTHQDHQIERACGHTQTVSIPNQETWRDKQNRLVRMAQKKCDACSKGVTFALAPTKIVQGPALLANLGGWRDAFTVFPGVWVLADEVILRDGKPGWKLVGVEHRYASQEKAEIALAKLMASR